MFGEISPLLAIAFCWQRRQKVTCPNLPVGMRIGATHDRTAIFKHLYPTILFAQFTNLLCPKIYHRPYILNRHLSKSLIFFGAKKIPELARGLGKGIREFKDATREIKDEIEDGANSVNDAPRKIAK